MQYVAVFQPGAEYEEMWKRTGDGSAMTYLNKCSPGALAARLPEKDYPDFPFPEHMQNFAFPNGVKLAVRRQNDVNFCVGTDSKGANFFMYFATLAVPISEERKRLVKLQVGARLMNSDDGDAITEKTRALLSSKEFFEPHVICAVSIHRRHRTVLLALRRYCAAYRKDARKLATDPRILKKLWKSLNVQLFEGAPDTIPMPERVEAIPLKGYPASCIPSPGNDKTSCLVCGKDVSDSITCCKAALPIEEHDFTLLLASISAISIVNVVERMVHEKSIVFVSSSAYTVSACMEAFVCLLYPFRWLTFYVSALPWQSGWNFEDLMSCPTPFLLGTTRERYVEECVPEEVMVVDLDRGVLKMPTRDLTPPFPKRHRMKLVEVLVRCGASTADVDGMRLNSVASLALSGINVTMRTEAILQSSSEDENYVESKLGSFDRNGSLPFDVRDSFIRVAFSRPLMSVFKGFREYLDTNCNRAPSGAAAGDKHIGTKNARKTASKMRLGISRRKSTRSDESLGVRENVEKGYSSKKKKTLQSGELVFRKERFLMELSTSLAPFASSVMDTVMYFDFLKRRIQYRIPDARSRVMELACFETLATKRMVDRVMKLSVLDRMQTKCTTITPIEVLKSTQLFYKRETWQKAGFKIVSPQMLVIYETDCEKYLALKREMEIAVRKGGDI